MWGKSNNSSASNTITQRLYDKKKKIIYPYLCPPFYRWALFSDFCFSVQTLVQVVHLAAADLPAPSLMLPGSSPCGVGFAVTSWRSSVNRGEHVDQVLHHQQGTAACQRHVIIWLGVFLDCTTRTSTCKSVIPQLFVVVRCFPLYPRFTHANTTSVIKIDASDPKQGRGQDCAVYLLVWNYVFLN